MKNHNSAHYDVLKQVLKRLLMVLKVATRWINSSYWKGSNQADGSELVTAGSFVSVAWKREL